MTPSRAPADGALVIGGDYKSLGVVRSLGRRGIPVWVLTDEHLLAGWSRYCRRAIPWSPASETDQVARLLTLADENGIDGWTLYPGGEEAAAMQQEFLPMARDIEDQQVCSSRPWELRH